MPTLVCPKCKSVILEDAFAEFKENLFCDSCATEYRSHEGCIDFVMGTSAEREFYETEYKIDSKNAHQQLDFEHLRSQWENPAYPERYIFFNETKKLNIKDKIVLLLGNGESSKELYYLKMGGKIIFSDLALNSVLKIKNKFTFDDFKNKIAFHSIDACNIPLENDSIDVIVGFGFTHHLSSLDIFLGEVNRVLKPGGTCLFMDAAYSEAWQKMKFTVLRPIVAYSHRRYGISPEDLRDTYEGGYSCQEIEEMRKRYKFTEMIFIRFSFFSYIFSRGMEKIGGHNAASKRIDRLIAPQLIKIDNCIQKRSKRFSDSTIRLVWGFKK